MTTAAIPSAQAMQVGEKNRSVIADDIIARGDKAMWLKMHETSGTVLTDSLGILALPTLTITGSPVEGTIWGNAGWFTAEGDNYVHIKNGSMDELMRLDNLTSGGLLISYEAYLPAGGAASNSYWFCSGRLTSGGNTLGGFGFLQGTNESTSLSYYTADGTKIGTLLQTQAVATETRHHMLWYLDVNNMTGHLYLNGVLRDTEVLPSAGGLPTAPGTTFGTACFAKSAGTPNIPLEADMQMRNLLVYRSETDISGSLNAIAADMYANPNQLPWELADG